MSASITEGYVSGCIGRITQMHASYYAKARGFGVEFESKVASELSAFCLSYEQGRDGIWLAHDGEIEGSIAIVGPRSQAAEAQLRWFITTDLIRGRGIGRQLLVNALAFADRCGYTTTYLWTFSGLDAARHLYEANGFMLEHESSGSQWGSVVKEQRFSRRTA